MGSDWAGIGVGVGYLLLDWALFFVLMIAVAAHYIAGRHPATAPTTRLVAAARRLIIVGLLLYASRVLYSLLVLGDFFASPVSELALLMWALGSIILNTHDLDRHDPERTWQRPHS